MHSCNLVRYALANDFTGLALIHISQLDLSIAVLTVEGDVEVIIKSDFDAVGFLVIHCKYYFTHSRDPFFEKRDWLPWMVMGSLP